MHKTALIVCLLTSLVVTALSFPMLAQAQVLINEVFPAPSSGDEWIELRNTTVASVNLTGWILEDNTGTLSTTPSLIAASFNSDGITVVEVKNRLNNSGDHVTLRRPDGSIADYFEYSASTTDQSWSRTSLTSSDFIVTSPTRSALNLIPSPIPPPSLFPSPLASASATPTPVPLSTPLPSPWVSPLPTSPAPSSSPAPSQPLASYPLQLSEIMSCPQTNEPEWIEFFNPNSVVVTVTNWKVKDSSSNTRSLNFTISAHSFVSIDLSSAILNNDGDTVTVLDQDARALITVEVPACEKGQSTVYSGGSWQQTDTPTKNIYNVFQSVADTTAENTPSPISLDTTPFLSESSPSTPSGSYSHDVLPASYHFADASSPSDAPEQSDQPVTQDATQSAETGSSAPATESGSVLGDSTNASSSASTQLQWYAQKPFLIGLFLVSTFALSIGGYGIYQWYTELHVESVLEDL